MARHALPHVEDADLQVRDVRVRLHARDDRPVHVGLGRGAVVKEVDAAGAAFLLPVQPDLPLQPRHGEELLRAVGV